jgi:hypothetical protein
MAVLSVPDFSSFINRQIETKEQLEACLWGLETLITVAVTTEDFYSLPERTLHNYFSIASDLIKEATKVNRASIEELFEQTK